MLRFILSVLLVIVMASVGCAKDTAVKESKPEVSKYQANFTRDLDAVLNGVVHNGTMYSVYVDIPKLNVTYTYQNKPMGSASMIKVFILEKAYAEIAKGNFSENQIFKIEKDTRVGGAGTLQNKALGTEVTAKTLLKKMIVESDNTATNMLIKHFGMDKINAYMQEHGYKESLLCRKMMDYDSLRKGKDNVTSVHDLGLFFQRVLAGEAVNPELDAKMVAIFQLQEDTNKIPALLPKGTVVAHKTGEINAVMNDGGIVYGTEPYVMCILTDKAPNYDLSIKQVAVLAKKINDVVERYSQAALTGADVPEFNEPDIVDKPVVNTDRKKQLMHEYARKHYSMDIEEIIPQAVVVHWTASDAMAGAFNWFNKEEYSNAPGTLNVGSQFMVDRDGAIYRLMPETTLARHAIGYNWCAIGIENVGGTQGEDLTEAQLQANIKLISYLHAKYPTIKFVWGHYQQDIAKDSGLYKENVQGYYSGKNDPGPKFMQALRKALESEGLKFLKLLVA